MREGFVPLVPNPSTPESGPRWCSTLQAAIRRARGPGGSLDRSMDRTAAFAPARCFSFRPSFEEYHWATQGLPRRLPRPVEMGRLAQTGLPCLSRGGSHNGAQGDTNRRFPSAALRSLHPFGCPQGTDRQGRDAKRYSRGRRPVAASFPRKRQTGECDEDRAPACAGSEQEASRRR